MTLRVAAVQLDAAPCEVEANLRNAERLVDEAASGGAALILLPELAPGGYLLTEAIWDTAETATGKSVSWLREVARRHRAHVGMSYLEAEGEHFYDTFVLAGPDGEVCGTVRKDPPASAEAFLFAAGSGPHAIDTSIGRLGVSICYEALLHRRLAALHDARVDLVLIPMAAARPTPVFPIRRRDGAAFEALLRRLPEHHARALGVPVVLANRCGRLVSPMPAGIPAQDTRFPGLSAVVDSDGTVPARLADGEGVARGVVHLDASRKVATAPVGRGRWALEVPWFSVFFPLAAYFGARAYDRNPRRAARASAVGGL